MSATKVIKMSNNPSLNAQVDQVGAISSLPVSGGRASAEPRPARVFLGFSFMRCYHEGGRNVKPNEMTRLVSQVSQSGFKIDIVMNLTSVTIAS